MSGRAALEQGSRPDPTLGEELAAVADAGPVEMVNLTQLYTGIAGTIFISTAMGSHGPRVKYFVKAGRDQASFSVSIADEPRVLANSLPGRDFNRAAPSVIAWVKANRAALLRFWDEGDSWSHDEVNRFVASLSKHT
jgi:hypothetical protein